MADGASIQMSNLVGHMKIQHGHIRGCRRARRMAHRVERGLLVGASFAFDQDTMWLTRMRTCFRSR